MMHGDSERAESLIEKLACEHSLELAEYEQLLLGIDAAAMSCLVDLAVAERKRIYGNAVFVRGLIEFTNHCANDCLYCGIRRSNRACDRYRLGVDELLRCAEYGYELGFRTFVLQGGEDRWFTDERLYDIVSALKKAHPDCAVTLSVGERSRESYQRLFDAGADRYLLRHETATPAHYAQLHPATMRLETRMRCLHELREIGYAVGMGFMVGSPFQTRTHLAADLKLIEEFQPEMCGIGPFIPHHATPFASYPAGTLELTCVLLSIIRLIKPDILLPATTALGTIDPQGREKGILAGANVVMPNLSPDYARQAYDLYDNKLSVGAEAARHIEELRVRMRDIGYAVVVDRGDPP